MNEAKIKKTLCEGILDLGGSQLDVAVLEDGTRIISHSAVFKALGREPRGNARIDQIPAFMDAKNLQSLIKSDLRSLIKKISYLDKNGKRKEGYSADILPLVADLYLQARDKNISTQSQLEVAKKAEVLVRSLARLGITALVDEATGYQYQREKDELQKILKAYISEELLPWQKKFPDAFYKELFRLNGWDFNVKGIKKRPGVIGIWTNKLIYERLPQGVLDELRKNTPTSKSGHKTARYHQLLTEDIGNPHLMAQIYKVIALFQISNNMKEVWYQFEVMKEREKGQYSLPLEFDEKGYTKE